MGRLTVKIVQESPFRFRIEPTGPMRVPGIVFTSPALMPDPTIDKSLEQVANVATLPGIVIASYAMPDIHWGYGFPIGGLPRPTWPRAGWYLRAGSGSTYPAG